MLVAPVLIDEKDQKYYQSKLCHVLPLKKKNKNTFSADITKLDFTTFVRGGYYIYYIYVIVRKKANLLIQ